MLAPRATWTAVRSVPRAIWTQKKSISVEILLAIPVIMRILACRADWPLAWGVLAAVDALVIGIICYLFQNTQINLCDTPSNDKNEKTDAGQTKDPGEDNINGNDDS